MKFENREFRDEDVRLDYNQFIRCRFYNCNIVYAGGGLPQLQENAFQECRWIFEDAADRTQRLLSSIALSGSSGRDFVLHQILNLPTDHLVNT